MAAAPPGTRSNSCSNSLFDWRGSERPDSDKLSSSRVFLMLRFRAESERFCSAATSTVRGVIRWCLFLQWCERFKKMFVPSVFYKSVLRLKTPFSLFHRRYWIHVKNDDSNDQSYFADLPHFVFMESESARIFRNTEVAGFGPRPHRATGL